MRALLEAASQLRIPSPGTNQKKSVSGAMDIRTGAFMHLIFDRKRAVEFIYSIHKAVVTANRLYGSMAALVAAVNAFFEQLNPSRVQTLAA